MALEVVASFGVETVDGIIVCVADDGIDDDDDDNSNKNNDDDDDSLLLLRVCVGLISDAESPVVFVFDCLAFLAT